MPASPGRHRGRVHWSWTEEEVKPMTGSDLVVLMPWLVFAAALVVIGVLLFRSRRARR
ncbi:MAG: LPXTG cell wall anchor domain-containing protein [Streptosporangiaceae bacterium]